MYEHRTDILDLRDQAQAQDLRNRQEPVLQFDIPVFQPLQELRGKVLVPMFATFAEEELHNVIKQMEAEAKAKLARGDEYKDEGRVAGYAVQELMLRKTR